MTENSSSLINDAQVLEYLSSHSTFFIDHEELLDTLHLPHLRNAGPASFIQHQLQRARKKNNTLSKQLHNFDELITANAHLLNQLHLLTLKLLRTSKSDIESSLPRLSCECFSVETALLWKRGSNSLDWQQEPLSLFDKSSPSANEIDAEQSKLLLGESSYLSICIVPLGEEGNWGGMFFASSESTRFPGDKDTMLLKQYGQIVEAALKIEN